MAAPARSRIYSPWQSTINLIRASQSGLSGRGYILQTGRIVGEGSGAELMASDQVKSAFLGL